MLVAAAVCPQTPLLVPEVAGGAADELADVREACLDVVTRVSTRNPDLLVVIAPGAGSGARVGRLEGTFRRFGVDFVVGAAPDGQDAAVEPCCGLLVGRWLLDAAASSADFACEAWEIGEDTEPAECARLGRELARRSERVAFLVMADGSARRTLKAPGYLDDRAEPFDDEIARALATVDTKSLAGRAAWQVLAGAADAGESDPRERQWHGELLSCCAPYGVGYFAALWVLGGSAVVDV